MSIQSGTWRDALEYAAGTDIGMRRGNNQDSHIVALAGNKDQWRTHGHLITVADGMGAHAAGELASQMAVENVPHTYFKITNGTAPSTIQKAIVEANRIIHSKGQANSEFNGMGTTCSTLLLLPEGAVLAHVGDSRVYRLRNNELEQLSFDHSLVWEMAEAGHLAEEDVPKYIPKNVITRCLGPHPTVDVDLEGPFPLMPGDTFLVCSDGLTGPVQDIEIGMLMGSLSPKEAVQTLMDLANLRGGPDNITVAIARHLKTAGAEPQDDSDNIGTEVLRGDVHFSVWAGMAASVVFTLAFFALANWPVAGLAFGVFLITSMVAVFQRKKRPHEVHHESFTGPLGKGPYRKFDCKPSEETVASFANVANELRDVANAPDWEFDITEFVKFADQGDAFCAKEEYSEGIKQYAAAIRTMMEQAREQRIRKGEDSSIR